MDLEESTPPQLSLDQTPVDLRPLEVVDDVTNAVSML